MMSRYFDGRIAGVGETIRISLSGPRRTRSIQSTSSDESLMRRENTTPQTNGGCIRGKVSRLRHIHGVAWIAGDYEPRAGRTSAPAAIARVISSL